MRKSANDKIGKQKAEVSSAIGSSSCEPAVLPVGFAVLPVVNERVPMVFIVSNIAKVWNTSTGECIWTLAGHNCNVASAAFSPKDSFVVTALADGTTIIWSAATGETLHTLARRTFDPYDVSVAFSADEAYVLTASNRTTVNMWSIEYGECLV